MSKQSSLVQVINEVAIVGAGTMGAGIAEAILLSGKGVILTDLSEDALKAASGKIHTAFNRKSRNGKISEETAAKALAGLRLDSNLSAICTADLVIEAATEQASVKSKLLQAISHAASSGSLIATNTSSLSVSMLAENVKEPGRFIGMHFFNPASVMPLVEVIKGDDTSGDVVDFTISFLREIGKDPVVVRDSPGFVVNRLLIPMLNEAFHLLEDNVASASDIDFAMKAGANLPIGPFSLADMIGLDVCTSIMESLAMSLPSRGFNVAPLLLKFVGEGRLGRKTGRGVYDYE